MSLVFNLVDSGGGGGGESLNFRILGGTTAPASPQENDIWVKTSKTLGGWTIDRTYPVNPADGDLLITARNVSIVPLQVLSDQNVVVYPAKVERYDATLGSWERLEAYLYRSGGWICFAQYLYKASSGEDVVLGNWELNNGSADSNYAPYGTLSVTSSGFAMHTGNAQKGSAVTGEAVDLTSYTRLIITLVSKGGTGGQGARAVVVSSKNGTWAPTGNPDSTVVSANLAVGSTTLNIENLSGNYYVRLLSWQSTDYTVTEIRLE